jgi:hypothetical protein
VSNSLFHGGREGFLTGEIVWKAGGSTIKASLVRGYTFNANHRFVADITNAGGVVVATVTLASLTSTNGVASAANWAWPAIPDGVAIPHILFFQASAVTGGADLAAAAQRVIGLEDQGNGLPVLPNGEAINYTVSPGPDRIFRL